jgi:phospholipase C
MRTKDPSQPNPLTRRRVLGGLGAALGAATFGCSEADSTAPRDGGTSGSGVGGADGAGGGSSAQGAGGAGGAQGAGSAQGASGAQGAGGAGGGAVDHCTDSGGLSAAELLARIDTIVVLCMENRSFDHFLGSLRLREGWQVDGLTGMESNPAPDGTRVLPFEMDNFTPEDPPHSWDAAHRQWNLGMNDGFVVAHAGQNQHEVMGYHVRHHLPILYALADVSAVCDRWFSSVMGPTWPNRFYLHGGTSKGNKNNTPLTSFTSVFELLSDAGIPSRNYYHDVAWCAGGYFRFNGVSGIERFFEDAATGLLPPFSIVDPQFFGPGANDDHPDHDVQLGQVLMASIYNALAQSPHWERCLFVITYDEHGGFFDHVPPPTTVDDDAQFVQLGFRVPGIVAGPFVRRGCVVSTQLEHVSMLRTLQTRFGLPSLNQRVDAANDLSSCIDPALFNNPQPPITLPELQVSMSRLAARKEQRITQPELWDAAQRGLIPRHLDRRSEGLQITRRVLSHAERLGAVRLRS